MGVVQMGGMLASHDDKGGFESRPPPSAKNHSFLPDMRVITSKRKNDNRGRLEKDHYWRTSTISEQYWCIVVYRNNIYTLLYTGTM